MGDTKDPHAVALGRSASCHDQRVRGDAVTSPDFERMADVCLARVYEVRKKGLIAERDVVAEQLRQVWNASGTDENELRAAVKTILRGFDEGVFIRSTDNDHDPAWVIKLVPFIQALAVARRAVDAT